jgi:hypothetical protein
MSRFNAGNLLWFGAPPVPPEPSPYLLGWNPALRKFKPFGLPVKKLACANQASAAFVAQIKSMIEKVPPGIQATLIEFGVAILPGYVIFDICHFSFPYHSPRGHDGRMSWSKIAGLSMFEGHLLIVCQYRDLGQGLVLVDNAQGIFNHELGHCLDAALKYISKHPEFLARYAADIAKLSASDRAMYQYFLQPDEAGPSEAFADLFACTQGESCVSYWTKKLPEAFPSCFEFVKNLVEGLMTTSSPKEITNDV